MKDAEIIIIGAGAAGLAAAQVLTEAGRQCLLIEARRRIGGRIFTKHRSSIPLPIELGAEFVHGRPKATWDLIQKANLTAYQVPFDNYEVQGGRIVKATHFPDQLNLAMKGLARLKGKDISFAKYLRDYRWAKKYNHARKLAEHFVEGFDAADLERISSQSLAEEQEGLGDLEDESQYRLLEGYSALMAYLQRTINPQLMQFRFAVPVYAIEWQKSRVLVRCVAAGRSESYTAAACIVTVPISVLARESNETGAIQFTPDVAEKRKAIAGLTLGPVIKVVLQFKDPFWHSKGAISTIGNNRSLSDASFIHDLQGSFPTWWTARPIETGLLTAWSGGRKAMALSGASNNDILQTAISSLAHIFGKRTKALKSALVSAHTHNWQADIYSGGAYSYVNVGGMRSRSQLATSLHHTLFFAGEGTDTTGQASTVAGAIASGQRAARQVLSEGA